MSSAARPAAGVDPDAPMTSEVAPRPRLRLLLWCGGGGGGGGGYSDGASAVARRAAAVVGPGTSTAPDSCGGVAPAALSPAPPPPVAACVPVAEPLVAAATLRSPVARVAVRACPARAGSSITMAGAASAASAVATMSHVTPASGSEAKGRGASGLATWKLTGERKHAGPGSVSTAPSTHEAHEAMNAAYSGVQWQGVITCR